MRLKKCPNCKTNNISLNEIFKKTLLMNYCSKCSVCDKGWSINKKFSFLYSIISPLIGVILIFVFFDLFDSISYGVLFGIVCLYGFEISLNYFFPLSKCESPIKEKKNWLIFFFVPLQIALGFVIGGHIQDLLGFPYNILGFFIGFLLLPLLVYIKRKMKIMFNSQTKYILERKDILDFKIQKEVIDNEDYLILSGLAIHSALSVYRIIEIKKEDLLCIKIYLRLGVKNGSGSFQHKIRLEKDLTIIGFGKSCETIYVV